jgi:hypothetical protein
VTREFVDLLQQVRQAADHPCPKKWGPRNTRKDAKGDERCEL